LNEETYNDDYENDTPKPSSTIHVCELCGIHQPETLIHKLYCEKCSLNLGKAYKWLQSPLLPEVEIQEFKQAMYEMTDIKNLSFD